VKKYVNSTYVDCRYDPTRTDDFTVLHHNAAPDPILAAIGGSTVIMNLAVKNDYAMRLSH
jgi:hypothetical protein